MARTLTLERQQLKAHAITLRRQGWTESRIAEEIGVPRRTLSDWLTKDFGDNATMGNTAKAWKVGENRSHANPAINLQFRSFLGKLESFQTDIRFPVIIADPPWNISVENSMQFTFKDKTGKLHTPMKRDFGSWDFMGGDADYLPRVEGWLKKLFSLAAPNAWCWFWCSYRYLSHINNSAKATGWEPKGWYVWAKTNVPPLTATINGTLLPSLEPCLIFRKGKGQLRINKTGHCNYKKLPDTEPIGILEELPMVGSGARLQDAENIAAKPIAILSDFIEWSSKPGDWVLDAFTGTGSTSRAALMKRRNAFAVESDKRQLTLLLLHIEEKYGSSILQ